MTAWEPLEAVAAFDFTLARRDWDNIREDAVAQGADSSGRRGLEETGELALLGAAQMQVMASFVVAREGPAAPLLVLPGVVEASFVSFACSLTYIHADRAPTLADVAVFSGDLTKLGAIGLTELDDVGGGIDDAVSQLTDIYKAAPSASSVRYAEQGWLHLQALAWTATASYLLDQDARSAIDAFIERHPDRFPRLEH